MTAHGRVNTDEARRVGELIGITGKIALAHLNEFPDRYTRLKRMEDEADREWRQARAGSNEAGR